MIQKRKGITPVIAIVLLLLVTVGAVGVVYTQFQSLVGNPGEQTKFLNNDQLKFTVVTRNTSNSFDQMQIKLENTAEQAVNVSNIARLEYSIPGEQRIRPSDPLFGQYSYSSANKTCLSGIGTNGEIASGSLASCNTGVEMPSATNEITVHLVREDAQTGGEIASYTCSPSSSGSFTC